MEPGEQIGDYVIVRRIGEDGVSVVYLAEHKEHGTLSVVKQLRLQLALNEQLVKYFVQGARIMQELHHPHLAAVYNYIRQGDRYFSGGLDVFMDCVTLRAGQDWERSLEQEINSRDLFLLFWSSHAKGSKWVTWEWQTALRQKGIQAIQLRLLQPVREVEPPDELKRLHFDDPLMVMREYHRMHPPGAQPE